jgi:hypothetical protein
MGIKVMQKKKLILWGIFFSILAIQAGQQNPIKKDEEQIRKEYSMSLAQWHAERLKQQQNVMSDSTMGRQASPMVQDTQWAGVNDSAGQASSNVQEGHHRNHNQCFSETSAPQINKKFVKFVTSLFHRDNRKEQDYLRQERLNFVQNMCKEYLDCSVNPKEGLSIGSVALLNGDMQLFEAWLDRAPKCNTLFAEKSVLHIMCSLNMRDFPHLNLVDLVAKVIMLNPELVSLRNGRGRTCAEIVNSNRSLSLMQRTSILQILSDCEQRPASAAYSGE